MGRPAQPFPLHGRPHRGVMALFEPNFDVGEYAGRLGRTQEAMRDRGFDILVVGDPANMNYLTGYNAWSFYTPQILVVPAQGDVTFYTREVDAPGAVITTRLTDDQVSPLPERYVHQTDCHPMYWIAARMRERGLGSGVIAVEIDAHFYSVRGHEALVAGLPDATFVSAQELVNWVRSVKSAAEVAKMRIAG